MLYILLNTVKSRRPRMPVAKGKSSDAHSVKGRRQKSVQQKSVQPLPGACVEAALGGESVIKELTSLVC